MGWTKQQSSNFGLGNWSFWMKQETLLDIRLIIIIVSEYYQRDWCAQNKYRSNKFQHQLAKCQSGEIEQQQKDLLEKNTIINQASERKKDSLLEIHEWVTKSWWMSDYYLYRSLDELLNKNPLSFLNKIPTKTNQWVVQFWKIHFTVDRNRKLLVKIKRNLWNAKIPEYGRQRGRCFC